MIMLAPNKRSLSERDICSKFITPALVSAKWDLMSQIGEEISFAKGRGLLSMRGDGVFRLSIAAAVRSRKKPAPPWLLKPVGFSIHL
jgi:hypothetical protein